MKILAIRLKNLASLAGEHTLDFTREPLASAGLLAITGPTGAGKSTLLDALCLALFATTPRLRQADRNSIPDGSGQAENSITTQDSRNLLRRGSSDGFAEVDFTGSDDRPYRARWSVRRARNRASGKLQSNEHSLLDLTSNQLLANQARETAALIEQRLGLNREQFMRAVLLAQSEFSAFLRADDNERAGLLEKLTDTGLYSQLGIAAYQAEKQAREALEQLQREAGSLCPLTADERSALDAQLQEQQQALAAQRQQLKQLENLQQWQQQLSQLQQAAQHASLALQQAEAQQSAAQDERLRLQQLQQLAGQRHHFQRRQQLQQAQHSLAQQISTLQSEQQQQQDEQAHLQQQAAQSASALQTAIRDNEQARSPLNEAIRLEGLQQQASSQLHSLQQRLQQAEQAVSQSSNAWQQRDAAQQRRRQQHEQIGQRLQAQSSLAELARQWPQQQGALQQSRSLRARLLQGERELPDLAQKLAALDEQHSALQQQLEQSAPASHYASELQALQQQLQQWTTEQAQRRQQLRDCQQLQQIDQQQQDALARQHRLQQRQQAIADELQALTRQLEQTRQQLQQSRELIALQQLARSQRIEALRADLKDGEHCPVCGSCQHPWHQPQQLLADFAAVDAQLLQHSEQQLAALQTSQGRLLSEQQHSAEELQRLQQQLLQLADQSLELQANLASLLEQSAEQRSLWLQQQLQQLDQRLQQASTQQTELRQQQQHSEQLQQQSQQLQSQLHSAQRALEQQQQALQADQHQLAVLEAPTLALLPADWRDRWQQQPAQTLLQLEPLLLQYREDQDALSELDAELASDQQALQRLQQELEHQQQLSQQLQQEHQDLLQRQQDLRQQLAAQLGQQSSAQAWQQQLEQQLTQTREQDQQQQAALARSQLSATELQTRLAAQQSLQHQQQQELDELTTRLQQWRQSVPELDDVQLQQLLQVSDAEVAELRQQLEQLDQALGQCRVLQQERQQRLQSHQQQRPQGPQEDELPTALAAVSDQLTQLESQCADLLGQQREDERRREQGRELLQRIEAARALQVRRARLSEVIGSADGSRFRRLVQGCNLDLLLAHANQQLQQLARRYRLQRGGSELGLLVIDCEMGDERRSIHSLSGGESFLVSLALALGLADMASGRLRIESLFIDEGFGSLDPQSLQLALDALDSLQARGRKVAVISHVQELHERIPVQIRVQRHGNGASGLKVLG